MEMDNVNVEQVEETIALFSSMDLKTAVRGLLFLVVGLVLVRLALMLLSHMLKKSRTIPASAHTMIKTLMRILLDVVVVLAAANTVGIPITSFMVFLSVIGIAISLAVQGILSNFAGGILLLVSRPFAIGDFIECGSVSGTVLDITMLHIKLQAPDRKVVYLPNSTVYSSILTNASISAIRRVDVSVSASYDNSPAQVRELVYQSAAYLGFARARVFLAAANGVFAARGVSLPREQEAPDAADRLEAGARVQAALFGEETADFWQYGPEETRHLGRMMVENCFGDFYSRGILSLKDRELAAFCTLAALGGGAQLKVRVVAGYAAGNDRAALISALTQLVPVIGWTRVLNALAILTETDKELNDDGYDDDPF